MKFRWNENLKIEETGKIPHGGENGQKSTTLSTQRISMNHTHYHLSGRDEDGFENLTCPQDIFVGIISFPINTSRMPFQASADKILIIDSCWILFVKNHKPRLWSASPKLVISTEITTFRDGFSLIKSLNRSRPFPSGRLISRKSKRGFFVFTVSFAADMVCT